MIPAAVIGGFGAPSRGTWFASEGNVRDGLRSLAVLALFALSLTAPGCAFLMLGPGAGPTWTERSRHPSARPFQELAADIEHAFAADERASVHLGESKVVVRLDPDARLEVRDRGDRVLLVGFVDLAGGPSRSVVIEEWMDVGAALPGVGARQEGEER